MSFFLRDGLDARSYCSYCLDMNNALRYAPRFLSPTARRLRLLEAGFAEVRRLYDRDFAEKQRPHVEFAALVARGGARDPFLAFEVRS